MLIGKCIPFGSILLPRVRLFKAAMMLAPALLHSAEGCVILALRCTYTIFVSSKPVRVQ